MSDTLVTETARSPLTPEKHSAPENNFVTLKELFEGLSYVESRDLQESIYWDYEEAITSKGREALEMERFIAHFFEDGNFEETCIFGSRKDGFILGSKVDDVFIPTHFAPAGLKQGYRLLKDLMAHEESTALFITNDLVDTIKKMKGWKVLPVKFDTEFRGETVEKRLVVNEWSAVPKVSFSFLRRAIKEKMLGGRRNVDEFCDLVLEKITKNGVNADSIDEEFAEYLDAQTLSTLGQDPQQENTDTKQNKASLISRRKFLRSALIGGTGLLLSNSRGLSQPPPPRHSPPMPESEGILSEETSDSSEPEKVTPQEQFERLGMAEFWPFYEQVSNVCEKFGATKDSYYFNRVFTVCDKVATGQITDEHDKHLQEVRDGWLEGRGQLQADAAAHIASLNISNHDTSGDPEIMRTTYLPRLAATFGPMVMAMPANLYVTAAGATTGEDLIATVSFAQYGEEEAWSQLYHELTHAADVWSERVQPYVDHSAFLEYATEYFIQAEQLLEEFYSSESVEAAREYWKVGSVRPWGIEAAEVPIESLEVLEKSLFSQTFEGEAFDYRVQRIVWTLRQDEKRGEQSSQTLPPDLSTHAEILQTAVLRATLHYLVNAPEYAFFNVQQEGMYDSSPEHARIAVHEKRIKTFASFPLDTSKDLELQVREQLQLS